MLSQVLIAESVLPKEALMLWLLALALLAAALLAGLAIGLKISANPKRRGLGYSLASVSALLLLALGRYIAYAYQH